MSQPSCLISKLSSYMELSERQKTLLLSLEESSQVLRRSDQIDLNKSNNLFVVKTGWILLKRHLNSSDTAVSQLYLPGDIIGLDTMCTQSSDDKITAASSAEVCPFPKSSLPIIFKEAPDLATLFFYVLGRDNVISKGLISAAVLLSATERLAYFILLLKTRLNANKNQEENEFCIKLTQEEIGQTISLSQHQVNRSMRELREKGLINVKKSMVTILNNSELEKMACFEKKRYRISMNALNL